MKSLELTELTEGICTEINSEKLSLNASSLNCTVQIGLLCRGRNGASFELLPF